MIFTHEQNTLFFSPVMQEWLDTLTEKDRLLVRLTTAKLLESNIILSRNIQTKTIKSCQRGAFLSVIKLSNTRWPWKEPC